MSTQVVGNVHLRSTWRVRHLLQARNGLLTWVRRVESLVVAEAVQVLVVLVKDFLVVFAVLIRVEIVEKSEEYLQSHQRVRTCLVLRAHSHYVELLRNLFETSVQAELVHERLDVEHVRCVVLEVLFKLLAIGR